MKTNSKLRKEAAEALAVRHDFYAVSFHSRWNGHDVFMAETRSDSTHFTGYPTFILVDANNKARLASSDETVHEIMGHSAMDIDYSESIS